MLFGLLLTLYTINCLLLVLIILIQQGKGGMVMGAIGGHSQMLFGGSGGQDIFQKASWILGAIYMFGSLGLAIMRTKEIYTSAYIKEPIAMQQPAQQQAPLLPDDLDTE